MSNPGVLHQRTSQNTDFWTVATYRLPGAVMRCRFCHYEKPLERTLQLRGLTIPQWNP